MKKKNLIGDKVKKGLIIASIVATGAVWWISAGKGKPFAVPAYRAYEVIDGDTFETADHQRVRLASTNAPEAGLCGSEEATNALKKLILGKKLYLKVMFNDQFKRLVSDVYTSDAYLNAEMIKNGFGYYGGGKENEALKKLGEEAKVKKVGIFSEKCTQSVNSAKPLCNIKGNVLSEKMYFVPSCGLYNSVTVQLYRGDRWFCSEDQAKKEGYRKPDRC